MKAANEYPNNDESSEIDFSESIYDLKSARDASRQTKNSDGDVEAHAGTLVGQLSEAPKREIEDLVEKLMTLHNKLQRDGDRIQLDIEDYKVLNERVRQLITIVSDSVKEIPPP